VRRISGEEGGCGIRVTVCEEACFFLIPISSMIDGSLSFPGFEGEKYAGQLQIRQI
jgi:hypothetical protein